MRRHLSRGGLSLVEMLVAFAIFGIFFISFMDTWSTGARAVRQARDVLLATSLAQGRMEQTLAAGFGAAATTDPVASAPFTVQVTVIGVDPETKDVVVTVAWPEGGAQRDVRLESLLCNLP